MKIELLDSCADDLSVANAARVSFAKQVQECTGKEEGLINFLMANRHGTPFEHGYFRFHVEAPIFVFREWHRHRAGHSYNEMSGRYVELEKRFYKPDEFRMQTGKPGQYTFSPLHGNSEGSLIMDDAYEASWEAYQKLLSINVAKEQARAVLPLGIYSQMYWSCNPRSLMHFLGLRNKPDAQKEIRDLAADAEKLFLEVMPITANKFIENDRVCP